MCHFPASGRNRARFPVPGPIPGTVIPVCGSGIRSSWQNKLVLLLGTSPNPSSSASLMAFKCAVVVSTIAVKRSNRAAALKAGRNGGQTNSTNFHLGQGEAGEEVSLSDSSFKISRQ